MNLYYQPPSEEVFIEMRKLAIRTWSDLHDDEFGYVTGKVDQIKDIANVGDNFMFMLAMFDIHGQRHLMRNASDELRHAVKERMVAGGTPYDLIPF